MCNRHTIWHQLHIYFLTLHTSNSILFILDALYEMQMYSLAGNVIAGPALGSRMSVCVFATHRVEVARWCTTADDRARPTVTLRIWRRPASIRARMANNKLYYAEHAEVKKKTKQNNLYANNVTLLFSSVCSKCLETFASSTTSSYAAILLCFHAPAKET